MRHARPSHRAREVVDRLRAANAGREPERLALKYRAMRASPFAFFRGTASLFWEDLSHADVPVPDAPAVWSCGDLHFENFGTYLGNDGEACFDLNDFDESALAPLTWEVVRFAAGVVLAGPTLALDEASTLDLATTFLRAYRDALADGAVRAINRTTATGTIGALLRRTGQRTPAALLDARTIEQHGTRRLRIDRRHLLTATAAQHAQVARSLSAFGAAQRDPAFYTVLDVARRVAGVSSLGLERFLALVHGDAARGNVLLDVKEAQPSSLARQGPLTQIAWASESSRIVTTQRRMQGVPPAELHDMQIGHQGCVMRALQPTEDRIRLRDAIGHPRRLQRVAATMAGLTASAQLRSSGLAGAASAESLRAFASTRGWRRALLASARTYAQQLERDYQHFVVAHEDDIIR